MSLEIKKQTTYFHINNSVDLKTIDLGHSIDSRWNVEDNYPYYSLNFLLSGETILEIADQQFTVPPNHFFLIPPNTPAHYYSKDKLYVCHMLDSQFSDTMRLLQAESPTQHWFRK